MFMFQRLRRRVRACEEFAICSRLMGRSVHGLAKSLDDDFRGSAFRFVMSVGKGASN